MKSYVYWQWGWEGALAGWSAGLIRVWNLVFTKFYVFVFSQIVCFCFLDIFKAQFLQKHKNVSSGENSNFSKFPRKYFRPNPASTVLLMCICICRLLQFCPPLPLWVFALVFARHKIVYCTLPLLLQNNRGFAQNLLLRHNFLQRLQNICKEWGAFACFSALPFSR